MVLDAAAEVNVRLPVVIVTRASGRTTGSCDTGPPWQAAISIIPRHAMAALPQHRARRAPALLPHSGPPQRAGRIIPDNCGENTPGRADPHFSANAPTLALTRYVWSIAAAPIHRRRPIRTPCAAGMTFPTASSTTPTVRSGTEIPSPSRTGLLTAQHELRWRVTAGHSPDRAHPDRARHRSRYPGFHTGHERGTGYGQSASIRAARRGGPSGWTGMSRCG
jgi:hypothetical protein